MCPTPARRAPEVVAFERRRFLLAPAPGLVADHRAVGRRLLETASSAAQRLGIPLPLPATPAPPVPAGAGGARDQPVVTPNDDFYRIDIQLSGPATRPGGR
jgi:hypothetical protein